MAIGFKLLSFGTHIQTYTTTYIGAIFPLIAHLCPNPVLLRWRFPCLNVCVSGGWCLINKYSVPITAYTTYSIYSMTTITKLPPSPCLRDLNRRCSRQAINKRRTPRVVVGWSVYNRSSHWSRRTSTTPIRPSSLSHLSSLSGLFLHSVVEYWLLNSKRRANGTVSEGSFPTA